MAKEKKKEEEEKGGGSAHGAEEKKSAAGAGGGGGGAGGLLKSTPMLLGGVMVMEAAVLFAGFKMFNGAPKSAHGSEIGSDEEGEHGDGHGGAVKGEKKKVVELNVLEFKAPNKLSGRLFLYDVSVYVTVKTEFKERVEAAFKDRE